MIEDGAHVQAAFLQNLSQILSLAVLLTASIVRRRLVRISGFTLFLICGRSCMRLPTAQDRSDREQVALVHV